MWIKIALVVGLFALLSWAVFKLVGLNRREKFLRRNFREPILSSKMVVPEDEDYLDEALISDHKTQTQFDDNDAILGIKSSSAISRVNTVSETVSQSEPAAKAPVTLVIHLMAPRGKPYIGYELLQALLAAGLRYGTHQMFHRHENKSGTGTVLFHLASVNAPGTFELSKMGAFSCPGLTIFMTLKEKAENLAIFETLLDTANELRAELGGELWDEQHKTLTMDKITKYRLRIRDYQHHKVNQLPDFFEQHS